MRFYSSPCFLEHVYYGGSWGKFNRFPAVIMCQVWSDSTMSYIGWSIENSVIKGRPVLIDRIIDPFYVEQMIRYAESAVWWTQNVKCKYSVLVSNLYETFAFRCLKMIKFESKYTLVFLYTYKWEEEKKWKNKISNLKEHFPMSLWVH